MTTPIPFATQAYELRAVQFAAQRCVNLFPEIGPPGAKTPIALLGTPGLTTYITVGQGPIRGLITMQDFLFAVSGNELYRISVNGATLLLGELPGIGLVKMATNGEQIIILTGTSTSDGFIATTTDLDQITDEDFLGGSDVDFIDGYFVISRPDSNEFYISGLYNGFEYDPLEFARAEGSPDNIVGLVVDHREIWLMCEGTTEVWYNAGNADFPFERASGTFVERGLAGRDTISQLDNTIMWVGDDRIVYRANGYSPVRVSTHAIEEQINDAIGTGDLISFGYSQEGHAQYVLKKPNNWTFVYDVATQLWHERCSCERTDYKVSTYADAFSRLLVGDDQNGTIYFLDAERAGTEDDGVVVSRMAAPPLFANEETAVLNALVVDFERGVGNSFQPTENPVQVVYVPGVGFTRDTGGNNASQLTISQFEVPDTVKDAILLVTVATENPTAIVASSISFGSDALTELGFAELDTGTVNYVTVFGLDAPKGTKDISITLSASSSLSIAHALIVENYDKDADVNLGINTLSSTTTISAQTTPKGSPSLTLSFTSMGEAGSATPVDQVEIADKGRGSMAQQIGYRKSDDKSTVTLGWSKDSGSWNRAVQLNLSVPAASQVYKDPAVMLRYSDDAGLTWSSEKWRSLGKVGEYTRRARWNRMGRFRQRILELSISEPVQRVIMGAYAKLERGGL